MTETMRSKLRTILFLILSSLLCLSALADSLSYSGRLVNTDGSPVAGPVTIRAELVYSGATTTILCTEDITGVVLTKGVFHLKLDLNCGATPMSQILEQVPVGQSVAIRITDVTNSKIYSFQALYSMPFASIAETSKQLVQMGATDNQVLKWSNASQKWIPGSVAAGAGSVTSVTGSAPLSVTSGTTTPTISITQADATHDGYLSSTKFNDFNSKEGVLATGTNLQYYRGDKSWTTLNTDAVPESGSTNLYFSNARALGVPLFGFSLLGGSIVAADTALQAFGKAQGQINSLTTNEAKYLIKNGTDAITGVVNVGTIGLLQLVYTPFGLNDATNKSYVDSERDTRVAKTGDTMSGILTLDNNLKIKGGSNYVTIKGHATSTAYNFVLPVDAGTSGYVLKTDGAGNLSWTNPSTTGTLTNADIGAAANIDASKIGTGIVSTTVFNYLNGATSSIQTQLNAKVGTTLSSAQIFVGNVGNVATGVAMSGDATIANTGAIALKNTGTAGTYNSVTTDAQGRVTAGTNNSIAVTAPILNTGTAASPALSMPVASGAADGYLASGNWTTFNGKQNAITSASTVSTGSITSNMQGGVVVNPYGTSAGNTGEIRLNELVTNGNNYIAFKSPDALAANVTYTLPAADGSSGDILKTSGTGTLSWTPLTSSVMTSLTGDVTASGTGAVAATVALVGGSTAANVHSAELLANAGTNLNTVSTLVKRDPSGNFTIGTITGNVVGNVIGNIVGNVIGNVTGNVTGSAGSLLGVLPLSSGGTGSIMTGIQGGMPYFNSTTTMATSSALLLNGIVLGGGASTPPGTIALGNSGDILTSAGAGGPPTWTTLLPLTNGGTGSATKNFVDLTTNQTIGGIKTFSSTIVGNISGTAGSLLAGSSTNVPLIYKVTTAVGAAGSDHIFQVGNNGATEAMRILNSGFVGIGTSAPSNNLSVTPLQYNTGTAAQSTTTVTGSGTTWTAGMVGSQLVFANGVSAGTITAFGSTTSLTVSTSQTVTSQAYSIGYTGLQVANLGNVGIGTTTPTAPLHVNRTPLPGTISSSSTTVTGVGTTFLTSFLVGDTIYAGAQAQVITAIGSNTSLTTSVAFTPVVQLASAYARVGAIGTVTTSGTTVTGVSTIFLTTFLAGDSIAINGQVQTITTIASNTSLTTSVAFNPAIATASPYARVGTILNGGSVGIGTAAPTAALEVVGAVKASQFCVGNDCGFGAKTYRYATFNSYDQGGGWMDGNATTFFGGIAPSTWTDGSAIASSMSSDKGVLGALFLDRKTISRNGNSLAIAQTDYTYSSTNGKIALALFRVRNNTGAAINWTLYMKYSSYSGWGEYASIAFNGVNQWSSGSDTYAGSGTGTSVTMSIPANRVSTVITTSSYSPTSTTRSILMAFYNGSLILPAGLEFVDDLDTITPDNGWSN